MELAKALSVTGRGKWPDSHRPGSCLDKETNVSGSPGSPEAFSPPFSLARGTASATIPVQTCPEFMVENADGAREELRSP